jgi:retinol dehydrogenase 12
MSALLGFLFSFHYSQLFITPALPARDFTGQTVIVTGSSSGLGLEAARHFVRRKASLVILAVRDVKKGEQAKELIFSTESTHRPDISSCVQVWELDLARYSSVKAFAKRVETLDRVDKVVENAGIYPTKFETAEGDEMGITVNVVSTFLLAMLLLPKLRESGKKTGITPTISVIGSFVHWLTQFPEKNGKEGIFVALANKEKADMRDRCVFAPSTQETMNKACGGITNPVQ